MKLLVLAVCFLSLVATRARAEDVNAFNQANHEFAAGQFPEAINHYEEAARSGETTANLFYNLGNAYFRMGDSGKAILNYERALALERNHPEALANLRLVRDQAHALELPPTGVEKWRGTLTSNQCAISAAVGFWLAAFGIVAWCFRRRRGLLAPLTLVCGAVLFAASAAAVWLFENGRSGAALAIVTAEKTQARLATADNSGTVLTLPPGSELRVLSTRGDWIYAALPNELRGWIPAQSAELVRK